MGEYVNGKVHTNGIESLWSMLKRSHKGTFHKLSPKQLQRYVDEFGWRQNVREFDTAEQLDCLAEDMEGKRLRYRDLIAPERSAVRRTGSDGMTADGAPNWNNRTLWTGRDNLEVMRGMNSDTVDLIYLDPPFNSKRTFSAPIGSQAAGAMFKDSWTWDDVDRVYWALLLDPQRGVPRGDQMEIGSYSDQTGPTLHSIPYSWRCSNRRQYEEETERHAAASRHRCAPELPAFGRGTPRGSADQRYLRPGG